MSLQWKSGGGADLPDGGATGQVLAKKSDANQDVEWTNAGSGIVDQTYDPTSTNAQSGTAVAEALGGVQKPSGWGVAKSGTLQVPIQNQVGTIVVNVNDLGLSSADMYNVTFTVVGGGTGAWGDSKTYLWSKTASEAKGSVVTVGADVDRVDVSYVVVARGYGDKMTGWGVAKVGIAEVTFSGTEWSDNTTIDVTYLQFSSNADYTVFVEGGSGGTVGAWGSKLAHVSSITRDNFTVGAYATDGNSNGTFRIRYVIFAKGFGGGGQDGGGASVPAGGNRGQALVKLTNDDGEVGWGGYTIPSGGSTEQILAKGDGGEYSYTWTDDLAKNLMREEYPYGTTVHDVTVKSLSCPNVGGSGTDIVYSIPKTSKIQSWNDFWRYLGIYHSIEAYRQNYSARAVSVSYEGSSISNTMYATLVSPVTVGGHTFVSLRFEKVSENATEIRTKMYYYQNSMMYGASSYLNIIGVNGQDLGIATETKSERIHNLTGVVLDDLKNSSYIPGSLSDTIVADFTQAIPVGKVRRPNGTVTTLWRKAMYIPNMPNNTTTTWGHGITGNFRVYNLGGYQYNPISKNQSNFCYAGNLSASNVADGTKVWVGETSVSIKSLVDRSEYEGWLFIDYFLMTD